MAADSERQPRDRKRKWEGARLQHGSRSAKKRDLGRKEWKRQEGDKRRENTDRKERLQRDHEEGRRSALPTPYSQEEIEKEERRPKHKVAVLLGYSGTGYKGMQIAPDQKTIEGDLFGAFVAAGAISKANASDPKKSQLVRCARTDKGVHAAGNVISLKLIIEDKDIVDKINSHLTPQIRVWGIQRTTNSFSAYQACDSRWYEYLMPTHSFLSPHPRSFLAKRLVEIAETAGDRDSYDKRQAEMEGFWDSVELDKIKPIIDGQPEEFKGKIRDALYETDINDNDPGFESEEIQNQLARSPMNGPVNIDPAMKSEGEDADAQKSGTHWSAQDVRADHDEPGPVTSHNVVSSPHATGGDDVSGSQDKSEPTGGEDAEFPDAIVRKRLIETALRELRRAYQAAKRSYRIQPERLARIQPVLDRFLGTKNFHNYTVDKRFNDPSAKRHIRSFKVNPTPIVIRGTEWLSFKIHGQSFMMHQIRKMIGMVALIIRSGCDPERIDQTFDNVKVPVPKAPALGLLLERPVFDSYNTGPAAKFERENIGFEKHEDKVEEFKRREIYQRQFDEEEEGNHFHQFFSHADNLKDPQLLYLSSRGFDAVKEEREREAKEREAAGQGTEAKEEARLDSDDEGGVEEG